MLMPRKLQEGDTVAITAASGPVNPEKLATGVKILQEMGLRPYVMESCHKTHEYLAGTDQQRLSDLHAAFANDTIKGILLARGGYGASRLLPHLDFSLIKQNPKILAGYSDVTALHIAINQLCQIITYHAPMTAADLPHADGATLDSFKHALMHNSQKSFPSKTLTILQHGYAEGILTGGNLTLIVSSLGTPWEIDTRGKILFIEEIGEDAYRIDRMLLQLKLSRKLTTAAGFLLGNFSPENLDTIKLALGELVVPEEKPIVGGLPCGHCMPNLTLPLGQMVRITTESLHPVQICDHFGTGAEHTPLC